MRKLLLKLMLASMLLPLNIYASEEEVGIADYTDGWRRYGYSIDIECGIFQFNEAKANSVEAKLNEKLLETFLEFEEEAKAKYIEYVNKEPLEKHEDDKVTFKFVHRNDIRGRSYVYINKETLFSARNEIYCERGMGAFVCKEGINYKILPKGDIEKIELKDLFIESENWLDALLIEAINTIKENGEEKYLWDSDAKGIINQILSYEKEDRTMTKQEYYISSFALKGDKLVLIMQSLSIMPNSAGYPIVEIPFKRIKHLKNLDFIK